MAVVIEIARGAAEAAAADGEASFGSDVGKFAVAEIAKQMAGAIGGCADEKEIRLAVAVVIEEAGAGGRADGSSGRSRRRSFPYKGRNGFLGEVDGDRGRSVLRGTAGSSARDNRP